MVTFFCLIYLYTLDFQIKPSPSSLSLSHPKPRVAYLIRECDLAKETSHSRSGTLPSLTGNHLLALIFYPYLQRYITKIIPYLSLGFYFYWSRFLLAFLLSLL
ncbi:hypothetical protein AAZX31_01G154300 [Glycine max]